MDTYTGASAKPEEKQREPTSKEKEGAGKASKEAVREKVEQVKESATEMYEQGKKQAASLGREIEHLIEEYPLRAVLVAGGLGLALGLTCR
jgi:ElaB/YqjD/DUF883 family membrane-anchored ribosome-binding protein